MEIKNLFEKDIDRKINGVIKIGDEEEDNKKQELEEYVVTKELTKYFSEFFDAYSNTINTSTKDIGVWISGFYGSGKSHFMKILSYVIENESINGKKPVEFFKDGNKIDDPLVLANMDKAASITSDVMLFNIESLSNDDHKSKEAILSVFLRAFNRKLGYDDRNPAIAEFERTIEEENKYDVFKEKYLEVSGNDWITDRSKIKFRRKQFKETVTSLDIMSEEDVDALIQNVHNNVRMSVSDFAQMVSQYCQKKGPQHRVIFLVDEIGQYIADDTNLLLNLQTISEDFSTYCKGQAWIVVTSQQNIDEVTQVRGSDFSKIQARFPTRLSLSGSEVAEVIQKRILDKTDVAKQSLMSYYDSKESIIKNLIDFSEGSQFKKKYTNAEHFANVYPFIPYQFDLLGQVLTQIRNNSSSGKHLAEGERSMLALVQESTISVEHETIGSLVPFNKFYDCLEKWIDSQYRNVIDNAKRNEELEDFDVEILKVLFMTKYVKEIRMDIKNITTLMINNVDNDRVTITKKVEESLKRLIKQTYVQKDGDTYSFLTNAEQDLNRAIKNEFVENAEMVNEVKNIVFGELYNQTKFKYSNRYSFPFNQIIDSTKFVTGHPIGLMIVTPFSDQTYDADALRQLSFQENYAIFKMPDEINFQTEIINYLQIRKYLTKNNSNSDPVFQRLKLSKQDELRQTNERIKTFVAQALKEADVYVNGSERTISKGIKDKIDEALSLIVNTTYNKLTYMTSAPETNDFIKIFDVNQQMSAGYSNDNKIALEDVLSFIDRRYVNSTLVNYKNILDIYTKEPYGFINNDVHWLILKLYHDKKIELKLNGSLILETERTVTDIVRLVTDSRNVEKLIISKKKSIAPKLIKNVNDICKELSSSHINSQESDLLMKSCKDLITTKLEHLNQYEREYIATPEFPGKDSLNALMEILKKVKEKNQPTDFYEYVDDNYDNILDSLEDIEPVTAFFKGTQKEIFKNALLAKRNAENSNTYLEDQILKDQLNKINSVISDKNPYSRISSLPLLIDTFNTRFNLVLNETKETQRQHLTEIETQIKDELGDNSDLRNKFITNINDVFMSFRNRISHSSTLAEPYNIVNEANMKKSTFIQQINEEKLNLIIDTSTANDTDDEPVTPRSVHTYNVQELFDHSDKTIESEQDLDNQLELLKRKLMNDLDNGKIIRIKVR